MQFLVLSTIFIFTCCGCMLFADEASKRLPRVFIFLGAPGSGKGTQAMRLAKDLGVPHISTGDLFRDNISKGTPLGKKAQSYTDSGRLVPNEVVFEMLFERVSRPDCENGYVLDGFPRTMEQAETLNTYLAGKAELVVINLEVPDEDITKRLSGRLSCKSCNNLQNVYFSPPAKEGVCDKCQGELYQRSDDKPEVIMKRLSVYHAQSAPLVEYYSKQGVLVSINGQNAPDAIYQEVQKAAKVVTK